MLNIFKKAANAAGNFVSLFKPVITHVEIHGEHMTMHKSKSKDASEKEIKSTRVKSSKARNPKAVHSYGNPEGMEQYLQQMNSPYGTPSEIRKELEAGVQQERFAAFIAGVCEDASTKEIPHTRRSRIERGQNSENNYGNPNEINEMFRDSQEKNFQTQGNVSSYKDSESNRIGQKSNNGIYGNPKECMSEDGLAKMLKPEKTKQKNGNAIYGNPKECMSEEGLAKMLGNGEVKPKGFGVLKDFFGGFGKLNLKGEPVSQSEAQSNAKTSLFKNLFSSKTEVSKSSDQAVGR